MAQENLSDVDPSMARERQSHSGVPLWGGWSQVEANPRLSPRRWFGSYGRPGILDDMVRTDVAVQIGVAGLTLNLTSVPRTFLPASDALEHRVHAAFLNDVMKKHPGGGTSWLVSQAGRHAWGGVALIERWYQWDEDYELVLDGKVVMKGALLPRFAPIMPWAVDRWRPDGGMVLSSGLGDAMELDQLFGDAVELGPDEFIHLRHMPLGDDPTPYGMLRAAHPAFLLSKKLKLWLSIGFERASLGTPVIQEEQGANPSKEERAKARQVAANIRTGARSEAYLPHYLNLKFAEFPFRAKELLAAHETFQRQILQAMFMQAVEGGITGIGSYASISGHLALATSLVKSIDEQIVNSFDPVWEQTIRDNFPDHQRAFPTWHHPEIAIESNLSEWATAARTLKDAGFFEPNAGDEGLVTRRLQLSPRGPDRDGDGVPDKEAKKEVDDAA